MKGKFLFTLLAFILLVGIVSADTLIIYPENDLGVNRKGQNEFWGVIRNGVGTDTGATNVGIYITSTSTTDKYSELDRFGQTYNLTDYAGSTISSVKTSYWGRSKTTGFSNTMNGIITNASPTVPLGWQASDYNKFGNTLLGNYSYSSWATGVYNNATLNADGIAYFQSQLGSYATIMYRSSVDFDNNSPTWGNTKAFNMGTYTTAQTGTANDPFITIDYTPGTPPDTTPPASITNLANDTSTCEEINFTYDNPTDADFNGTQYWLDDVLQSPNLTKTDTSKLFTGLTGGTSYTFSTKTFDNATPPNVNGTFVNATAEAVSCGAAPVTSFTSNVTSGTAPLAVGFTDTSTNIPDAWNWSFNNVTPGNNTVIWWSTDQNPEITLGVGNWSFALNASNAYGYNITPGDYWVNVSEAVPVASFTKNVTEGLQPMGLQVNDTSTNGPSFWNWSWGDDTWYNTSDSSEKNATHTYSSGGVYSLFLIAGNTGGSNQSESQSVSVYNQTIANFTQSAFSVQLPNPTVTFNDTSVNATWWNWSFHDESWYNTTSPATANTSFSYTATGNFTVNLTTTDQGWGTSTKYSFVNVYNATPAADFIGDPTEGNAPLNVGFTDLSTNEPVTWNWSFGDGNFSEENNPSYQYTAPGVYTVNLSVSNDGGSDYELKTDYITVYNTTPVANFTANITSGCAPQTVKFTDLSEGVIDSWSWKLNGVEFSTEQNPEYEFTTPGLYEWLNLTVTNDGGSDTLSWQDAFYFNDCTPVAEFSANQTSFCSPGGVAFTDSSTNIPTDWDWYWGGDETKSSDDQNPTTEFTTGIYNVRLYASNAYGGSWENKTGYITSNDCGDPPVADFTANETDICKGDYVQFTDLSSNTPTGWDWIFDGFNGSIEQNPVFQYNVAGLFTVNLDASNAYGNDAENKVDYINVTDCSPVADFIANDTTPCVGDVVQFTDTSTGSPNSWDWDIDGDFFDVPNPTYIFAAGTYSINLTVCNAYGCDSELKTDYITAVDCSILPLNADFTFNVTCGNIPFNVAFTDTSTGSAITEYYWEFGDGNTSSLQNGNNTYVSTGMYTVNHSVSNATATSWKNVTGLIQAVPDWYSCVATGGGSSGGSGQVGESLSLAMVLVFGVIGGFVAIVVFKR